MITDSLSILRAADQSKTDASWFIPVWVGPDRARILACGVELKPGLVAVELCAESLDPYPVVGAAPAVPRPQQQMGAHDVIVRRVALESPDYCFRRWQSAA